MLDIDFILGHMNYWLFTVLMMTGLYIVVAKGNLIKKIVGLNLFQTAVFMFYISLGMREGATAPIFVENADASIVYANPLPHVLILTAIVVSVSTMAVALAIIVNIKREYQTIEADELLEIEQRAEP